MNFLTDTTISNLYRNMANKIRVALRSESGQVISVSYTYDLQDTSGV